LLPVPRKRQDNRIVFDSLFAEMASMSILDDAIREHLELKRAHGADEAEIKRLEDEAFGPPGRPEEPDPLAEAPTEFLTTPGAAEAQEPAEESDGRRINIADLQEPPPSPSPSPQGEPQVEATDRVELPESEAAPIAPAEDPAQAAPPAEEEPPAEEHEIVPDEPAAEGEPIAAEETLGHSTEERHAIAEQPTELFDIEAELGTEDAPAAEAPSPSDEQLVDAEAAEPRLAPVEPPTEIHASRTDAPAAHAAEEEEEDDDFWSEQRLSDELDQALDAPPVQEDELDQDEDEPASAAPAPSLQEEPAAPAAEPQAQTDYDPDTGHEDVLEDTPDFLEDAPEDDELWFEQRPPKDFDFDD
jgi:hypothetical protein